MSRIVGGLVSAALAALTLQAASAPAADYPDKPIRFIVPFPPGGNTDVLSRLLSGKLSEALDQQFVVDNRAGAGGTIGVALATKAPADGYTIVMGSFGSILLAGSIYKNLPYDPVNDLEPVILVATPPGLMVSHPSLPAATPRELIALARAKPGQLNFASAGNASWNHLFGELFKAQANIEMTHVPYKGTAPAISDVMGGRIEWMFAPFPPALPQIKNKRLRALAVTSERRSAVLPSVPTVSESGLPGYKAESWFGVLAPRGTPAAVLEKLNAASNKALASADVRTALARDGTGPAGGTREAMRASIAEEIPKWRKIVDRLGLAL